MTTTMRRNATVFTMPNDLEVVATRTFDAPRRLVWACFTDPKHVSQWIGGFDGWTMTACEIDLRVGGTWRYAWRKDDGTEMVLTGEYREIVPIERLVNTENWGGDWPEALATYAFVDQGRSTLTTCTATYPSREARDRATATGMTDGWELGYDRLEAYLKGL